MGYETIGEMPPEILLAFVIFGVFIALSLKHVITLPRYESATQRIWAWIVAGFAFILCGIAVIGAIP